MRVEQSTSLCDIKYKVVFLGDMSVGKTSIIQRFVKDEFEPANNPTIGIDFLTRNLTFDGRTYRLQLWDTAGQEKYRSLVPAYLRDANCVVFVLDVTRADTLDNLRSWVQLFRDQDRSNAKAILMANKVDLPQRVLSADTLSEFSKREGLIYWEVSAKTGEGVSQCFAELVKSLSTGASLQQQSQEDQNFQLSQKFFDDFQRLKSAHDRKWLSCCYI